MKNWENETNCTTIIAMKLLAMSIHGVPSGAIMNNSKKNWSSVWVIITNRLYTGFKKTYKWVHCSINYRKEHWNWEIKDLHRNFSDGELNWMCGIIQSYRLISWPIKAIWFTSLLRVSFVVWPHFRCGSKLTEPAFNAKSTKTLLL